jgi:hypothetical protein
MTTTASLFVFIWLALELIYAAVQRLAIARGEYAAWLRRSPARRLFWPLGDRVSQHPDPAFRVRDLRYLETFGIYRPGAELRLELGHFTQEWSPELAVTPVLLRVTTHAITGRLWLDPIRVYPSTPASTRFDLQLPADLRSGQYLIEFRHPGQGRVVYPLFADGGGPEVRMAVVVPTFTVWGYHETDGFYPGHARAPVDLALARLGRSSLAGFVAAAAAVVLFKLLGLRVTQPQWPAHRSIELTGFFKTNHRWPKALWDEDLDRLDGLWTDDIDCVMPLFALLDRLGAPFRVVSDVDVHRDDARLKGFRALLFTGQESMTESYFQCLRDLAAAGVMLVLWGVQGFGYRQVVFDDRTGRLTYVCSRGKRGFWGERLEDAQPPWNEGELFGFWFPSPDSPEATNPHRIQYSRLVVDDHSHWLVSGLDLRPETSYAVFASGAMRPGLNWMGGEPFRRVVPEARVIAHLDRDVIGLGEYKSTIVVSPTFLPAYGVYQPERHPEVLAILERIVARAS